MERLIERFVDKADKDVLIAAIEKWGAVPQIIMVMEEMSELQKELCKNFRGKHNNSEIAEEIADVEIMLEQLKLIFDIPGEVDAFVEKKMQRLKERVKAVDAREGS